VRDVPIDTTPLLAHVAGVPVEEVLPGVLACGAVGVRMATVYVRRRVSRRARPSVRPGTDWGKRSQ
jgi:hypothetical protein